MLSLIGQLVVYGGNAWEPFFLRSLEHIEVAKRVRVEETG